MKGKGKWKKENSRSTMPTIGNGVGPRSGEVLVPAFAKLQGEYFEYYMRKYSIILGRHSKKKSNVDLDLRSLAWGTGISRNHARIYYDFTCKCFALEVIGSSGCIIKNVLYLPGSVPIKLNSQDLLQIGNVRFYFLLPSRSFFETLGVARQIAPPPLTPLMVVQPTLSNDESKVEESLGIGHAVRGLIFVDSNSREPEGSCGVLPCVSGVARLIVPPLLPPLPVVLPSMDVRMGERGGNREESLRIGHGASGVSGLVVEEINASKTEGSSGMLSGILAARQIVPPLLPPLVVVPPASSNDERKGEERKGDREECLGVKLGKGGANGLIVEEFKAGETEAPSDVLSGVLTGQSSLSNKKQEPRLRNDREKDNQEETNDVHVVKIDLPGIKKEQIKLVIEEGKIWIQISEDAIENEEDTSMCQCVEDNSSKFILPENAKINEIKASMENSVLTVTVPMGQIDKSEQPEVKSVEISG